MTSAEILESPDTGAPATASGASRTQGAVAERVSCVACSHDAIDHDAISSRYCQATQAQALARRCICAGQG
jgi:hypothetical protein